MEKPVNITQISKEIKLTEGLDFTFLRGRGIELLQQYSSKHWTDYNRHDPGVTILEALCYALTDLGYRATLSIPDLLTTGPDQPYNPANTALFPAHDVFSNHPVTLLDYRKLALTRYYENEKQTIQNIWITTVGTRQAHSIPGLYQVHVEPSRNAQQEPTNDVPIQDIHEYLNQHRNLGELFIRVRKMEPVGIVISGAIHIQKEYFPDDILANALAQLSNYFLQTPTSNSLAWMQKEGFTTEEIFDGPADKKSFYDRTLDSPRPRNISIETLSKLINAIPGVRSVEKLVVHFDESSKLSVRLNRFGGLKVGTRSSLKANEVFQINIKKSASSIRIYYQNRELQTDADSVASKYYEVRNQRFANRKPGALNAELLLSVPPSKYLGLSNYDCLQYLFPAVYGIGQNRLSSVENTPIRQAQILQLKGFLTFFDQIMADYCAQLSNLTNLYAIENLHAIEDDRRTYFCQQLPETDVNTPLLNKAYTDEFLTSPTKKNSFSESWFDYLTRRKRLLTHLLARFGHAPQSPDDSLSDNEDTLVKQIDMLESFLKDIVSLSYSRGAAMIKDEALNYYRSNEKSEGSKLPIPVSGLEHALHRLTGYCPYQIADSTKTEEKRFLLIDHILLLPTPDQKVFYRSVNGEKPQPNAGQSYFDLFLKKKKNVANVEQHSPQKIWVSFADLAEPVSQSFFSYQITLLFPKVSASDEFVKYIQQAVETYCPAYLMVTIHWITARQLADIGEDYQTLLAGNESVKEQLIAELLALM